MTDLDERLSEAIRKRNKLESEAQRIAGRREAALGTLAGLEKEISDRGLDPSSLSDTVADLRSRYETAISELEQGIEKAQTALTPYLETTP